MWLFYYKGVLLKRFILFITIIVFLFIVFIISKNTNIYLIILFVSLGYVYFEFSGYYKLRKNSEYIRHKFNIAEHNLANLDSIIILIVKNNKIIWANDSAFLEFEHLKKNRSANFLISSEIENNILKINNNYYKILEKGEVFHLFKYTQEYRKTKKLEDIKTIIGYLKIDNLRELEKSLNPVEYVEFISEFNKDLFELFLKNEIYYQEIENDYFVLNIPSNYIIHAIEDRFSDVGDIIKKFHEQNIIVTTSMGIAYNYNVISETGEKAKEALDLARSRGGAQIVVFDNENKKYFGGGITINRTSSRLRARLIASRLERLCVEKDVIYLVTHKNPDPDAIASMILLYDFLNNNKIEIKILIDDESVLSEYGLDTNENIKTSYVLDKTKKNIVICVDTQSLDIISHPKIIEDILDVIVIDHHQTPSNYFRGNLFSWIEPTASSTVELIMNITTTTNRYKLTNKNYANLGLLGILTDTNRLSYRTGYQTFDSLMNLVQAGGDISETLEKMYLKKDIYLEKVVLLSQMYYVEKFAILEIDEKKDSVFLSVLSDEMLEIKDIAASVVICKYDSKYIVKIRSKGSINSKLLIEQYGGGGHVHQAAGIISEEDRDKLLEKIKEH